jgi:hypothetical protein
MPDERPALSRQQLEQEALRRLAAAVPELELEVVRVADDTLPSTGERLFRFTARPAGQPNTRPIRIVLNQHGDEVNLAEVQRAEGVELFRPPPSVVDLGPIRGSLITVTPPTRELTLDCCARIVDNVHVTIPPSGAVAKADVYFLADTTFSMFDEIAAVQAGASSILSALAGLGLDIAFGVGNYRDFPGPASDVFVHQVSPTTTTATAAAGIAAWTVAGGGDIPEGQLFALDSLAEPPGGTIGWRPDSKRIIVWFGDAPGHDPICAAISGLAADITEASVTAKLVNEAISVLAIGVTGGATSALDDDPAPGATDYVSVCGPPGGTAGQATRIASTTGGTSISSVDATAIVSTIIALVSAAVATINNVSLVPAGDIAQFVTGVAPPGGFGPLPLNTQHDLDFQVTYEPGAVECTDRPQVFHGTLNVVADGVVVAVQQVTVTIAPCTYIYSVQFVCGRQPEERDRCATVLSGRYATAVTLHNVSCDPAKVTKRFIPTVIGDEVLGREPRIAEPRVTDEIALPPGTVTMDDCCRINELLFGNPSGGGGRLIFGVLEIRSSVELAVSATYTAGPARGEVASIDVERIEPKRC